MVFKTIKKQTNKKLSLLKATQKGFSLIELMLVLGISSIAFVGFLNMEKHKSQIQNSENAGLQFEEAGKALSQYINRESTFLKANIPVGNQVVLPIDALRNAAGTTGMFPNRQYLPATYDPNITLFNTGMQLIIRNNPGNILTGLVISTGPVRDSTGAIRYDYLGTAIKKMGPQGGMTFPNGNTLSGLGGQWTLTGANFPQINQLGLLGYRVQYQSDYDSVYLRLDGQFPMVGNLNMGNFSINNATDISYNGWLYGNNAVFNNLITGTITNSGNIQTRSINGTTSASVAGAVANMANRPYANFDLLYTNCINCGFNAEGVTTAGAIGFNATRDVKIGNDGKQGNLFVKDVVVGGTNRVTDNALLSDRLSRYADRGIQLVTDGDTVAMPSCPGSPPGIPKIELIPQSAYIQGRVVGPIAINAYDAGGGRTGLYLTQDQIAISGIETYATVSGSSWIARIVTPNYAGAAGGQGIDTNAPANRGKALAHIYCDYGT